MLFTPTACDHLFECSIIPISCKNDYFPDFLFLCIPLFFAFLCGLCASVAKIFYFVSDIGIIPISCKNDYFSGFLFLCIPLFFAFLCGLRASVANKLLLLKWNLYKTGIGDQPVGLVDDLVGLNGVNAVDIGAEQ